MACSVQVLFSMFIRLKVIGNPGSIFNSLPFSEMKETKANPAPVPAAIIKLEPLKDEPNTPAKRKPIIAPSAAPPNTFTEPCPTALSNLCLSSTKLPSASILIEFILSGNTIS